MKRGPRPPRTRRFVCPHCWTEVPAGARACPECGSDEQTGWARDGDKWAADIPAGYGREDDFDYDEFLEREFGRTRLLSVRAMAVWALVAALGIALLLLWAR